MNFQTAVKTCFSKYVTFSGRAARSEYWWFFLFGILGSLVAAILDGVLFGAATVQTEVTDTSASASAVSNGPIASIFSLAILLPQLSVGWRRMHDTGRSGVFLLYPLLVMVGISMFLAFFGSFGTGVDGGLSGTVAVITGLAVFVLAISPLIVLWWLTRPSQPGANAYGPNPHEVSP
ncbi:DUF805 domain-containing protein [Tateyamaria pelophila]|uniref:DUF805 domain-containing protein n=1 Tax=Tateyamaria pelophila TaxID=328415 RepID=UPI001CBBEAB5|nr:DUF805 domain-containing protein [Tateyamaria pelophila]